MERLDQQLDRAALSRVVQQLHSDSEIVLDSWQVEPLAYANLSPDSRALYRISGAARRRDQLLRWSAVLKVFVAPDDPALDDPAQSFYWRRESLLYESGLLHDSASDFVAPHCLGLDQPSEREIWLWLEDLDSSAGDSWSLERFGVAARQIGQFQGAFLTTRPLPVYPWPSRGLIRAWTAGSAPMIERIARPDVWDLPLLRAFSPAIAPAVLRLWAERDQWFDALERLPQTLCHHDLWRGNLFARRASDGSEQTIAIDWEMAGPGAPGEDIGNLLGVSLLNFDVAAEEAPQLTDLLIQHYLAGLGDAGWRGNAEQIRFAFVTAAALRCVFSTTGWPVSIALDQQRYVAETEQRWNRPIEQIIEQWATTSAFLLEQAQQARRWLNF